MNLLVDGNSVYWRAYSVSDKTLHGQLNIFLNMLKKYKRMYANSTMWICWDRRINNTKRNPRYQFVDEYKAGRSGAKDVFENIDIVEQLLTDMGIRNFHPSNLEADDCIAWLSTKLSPCTIFSADNDLAQLISKDVSFYNLTKKELITESNFSDYYDVDLDKFVLYKSIIGDASDNIPGIPKFGRKRSYDLAMNWDDRAPKPEIVEIVERNRKIIDLLSFEFLDDHELDNYTKQYDNFMLMNESAEGFDIDQVKSTLTELNLHGQLKKLDELQSLFRTQFGGYNLTNLRELLLNETN